MSVQSPASASARQGVVFSGRVRPGTAAKVARFSMNSSAARISGSGGSRVAGRLLGHLVDQGLDHRLAVALGHADGGAGHDGQLACLVVTDQARAVEQPLAQMAARGILAQHHHGFGQAPGPASRRFSVAIGR